MQVEPALAYVPQATFDGCLDVVLQCFAHQVLHGGDVVLVHLDELVHREYLVLVVEVDAVLLQVFAEFLDPDHGLDDLVLHLERVQFDSLRPGFEFVDCEPCLHLAEVFDLFFVLFLNDSRECKCDITGRHSCSHGRLEYPF